MGLIKTKRNNETNHVREKSDCKMSLLSSHADDWTVISPPTLYKANWDGNEWVGWRCAIRLDSR